MSTFCSKGDFGPGKSEFYENVPGFSYTFLGTKRLLQALFLPRKEAYCRNRLRRCRDPTECEALHTEKDELTKQITETRKELHTAQQIPARVKRMRENIQLLNDREQQRAAHQKER